MHRKLDPEHALLQGLREGGDEAELTRAIAAVLSTEREMAADFVKLVLKNCSNAKNLDLSGFPLSLECTTEETVREGRVDLSFVDGAGEWHVIIENKIYASYGRDQIGRYLRSFHEDATRAILAAITRDVPTHGEPGDGEKHWAGSVRWARLLPGLRELKPRNPELARQWPLFFDVLESEGSMGFTQPDMDLFGAWAQYAEARQHMVDFIDAVRRPVLGALRDELASGESNVRAREALADFMTYGKIKRVVAPRLGKVVIEFKIPADGQIRLSAGVWGWGDPRFFVDLPFPKMDDKSERARAAVTALKKSGFESWRDRVLTRYLPLDAELLGASDLEEQIVDFAQETFRHIVVSGVLDLAPGEEEQAEQDVAETDS